MQRLLGVRELMDRLGIGRDAAYRLMHQKDFPSFLIGRKNKVSETALEEWIKKQEQQ
ncbi:helix-turn-helix domain-containing protein [Candidatus Agathobaculum pullicola]|uniref:helix-turn-helix domain-containing protein n=1 Tax=Candidatus Agathobaculum pullicola TaxID=2838426 RepID=UPI003F91E37A